MVSGWFVFSHPSVPTNCVVVERAWLAANNPPFNAADPTTYDNKERRLGMATSAQAV
jgi:hypothetical protein